MATPVNFRSPLLMDNDSPYVGNSPGADSRGRIHTKVSNTALEPIPVSFIPVAVNEFYAEASEVPVTPGVTQTLISLVVPANTQRFLERLSVTCRQESTFWLEANGVRVGSALTGPGQPSQFSWAPARPFPSGTTLDVKFQIRTGAPASVTVDCFLMGSDQPT